MMNAADDPSTFFDKEVHYYLTIFAMRLDHETGWPKIEVENVMCIDDGHPNHPKDFMKKLRGDGSVDMNVDSLINGMLMRARYGGERMYGVYAFKASRTLSLEDIESWAETDSFGFVHWLREGGIKLHDALPKVIRRP